MNPMLLADFYKASHPAQLPRGVTWAASNWIPRRSRLPQANEVVVFGMTYLCKRYFLKEFEEEFFDRPKESVIAEYRAVQHDCLGIDHPDSSHIQALHELGYLPLHVRALPEGSVTPLNVPHAVFSSTDEHFAWLPQYLETLISNILWKPSTNASTARRYRKIMLDHARRAGETDLGFVDWQGHDFSYRGMSGTEDAMTSGMAHLLSFSGTDSIPAILAARDYYGAPLTVGGSVPATEHWIMCAWIAAAAEGEDGELEGYKELITNRYPNGIVSIVSDTRNLWDVLTQYVPQLKERILARSGKVVIRPDSGDPVKILCGDRSKLCHYGDNDPEQDGVLRILARELGTSNRQPALPLINNAGAIYGDAITEDRCNQILTRTIDELRLSPFNVVFGIGSYTYQFVTRDTFSWKLAPAAMRINRKIVPLEKHPITDDGTKHSYRGLVAVYGGYGQPFTVKDNAMQHELDNCAYETVFLDSHLVIDPSFETIRQRVRKGL